MPHRQTPSRFIAWLDAITERRRLLDLLKRIAWILSGLVLIVLGMLMAPSPIPIGFILFVIGICLIAKGSNWMQGVIKLARKRIPIFSRGLNKVKHRLPEPVQSVIERSDPGE